MIVELRPKATLSLPKELAKQLKLSTGDKLDVVVKDGVITMTPVVVVERKYVSELRTNVNKLKKVGQENQVNELNKLEEVVTIIEDK